MAKLNQIVAVVNGKKTRLQQAMSELYKKVQSTTLFDGLVRKYRPLDDDGETFPPENKRVQITFDSVLKELHDCWVDPIDCMLTQDVGNTGAISELLVGEKQIATDLPVTFMLVLEKRLVDLRTFISKIPTLDPSEKWAKNDSGVYQTTKIVTNRTKKVPRSMILAEATVEHPAQVSVYNEDVKVGEWETSRLSGAITEDSKATYLKRVDELIDGIKKARERANNVSVDQQKIGEDILNYIFN